MKKKMKHSLVAAEVIAADNWSIVEALYENSQLLEQFFSFLTVNPPLSPPLLSACTKAAGALLTKKVPETIAFLRSRQGFVEALVANMAAPGVLDFLFKIIACDELSEGACGEWLAGANLPGLLVARLDPALPASVHETAADALLNIVHAAASGGQLPAQLDSPELLTRLWTLVLSPPPAPAASADAAAPVATPGSALISGLSVLGALVRRHSLDASASRAAAQVPLGELPTAVRLAATHMPALKALLLATGEGAGRTIRCTVGVIQPLGFAKLRIVEFVAALMGCNYHAVHSLLVESDMLSTLLSLFFLFPWNGFLHSTVATCVENALRSDNGALKAALFTKCQLLERLVDAVERNAAEEAKEKGMRLGYMAYVTQLTTSIISVASADEALAAYLKNDRWKAYADGAYAETYAIESRPIGGLKVGGASYSPSGSSDTNFSSSSSDEQEESDGLTSEAIFRPSNAVQGFAQDFPDEFNNDDDYDDDDDDIEITFDVDTEATLAEMERVLDADAVPAVSSADADKALAALQSLAQPPAPAAAGAAGSSDQIEAY